MARHSVSLIISTGLVVLLFIFLCFMTVLFSQSSQVYSGQRQQVSMLENVENLKEALQEGTDSLDRYIESHSTLKLNDLLDALDKEDTLVSSLSKAIVPYEDATYLYSSIDTSMKVYKEVCKKSYIAVMEDDESSYKHRDEAGVIASFLLQYCDDLISLVIQKNIGLEKQQQKTLRLVLGSMLLYIGIFIFFILLIIYLFSNWMRKPLQLFAEKAKTVAQGNFDVPINLPRADSSVALLADAFNVMQAEIKQKMDAEKHLAEEKQKNAEYQAMIDKARLAVLQAQTNPHFLYNSLNTISRTITLGQLDNSQSMIASLAALMRYNLSEGDEPAVLREEVEITEEYLKIQKMRFENRITWYVQADDELLDSLIIPRFTLQPLVENSVIHGTEPLERGGTIVINVKRRKHEIVLRIADNGVGIDKETLQKVLTWKSKRIGVANTRERLYIFTGDEHVMEIISRKGRGTMVILHFKEVVS